MGTTTIQISEEIKLKLEKKKIHPRESYDSVIKRILETEKFPTLQEMFNKADKIKQKKRYSTEEIIRLSHELREKR